MGFHQTKLNLTFRKFVYVVLGIRLIGAIGLCLAPVSSPHTWRQVDTMATALRYARRWTVETTDFAWWVPAVLNSRNTRGIMAMEFPALDLLGGVGFTIVGTHIDLGRILAQIMVVTLVILLIYLAKKSWSPIVGAPEGMTEAAMLAACFSFATPFTAKFMPDVTAMLLVLIGTAGLWRLRWWGLCALALGILIKPTACIAAALLLLHPDGIKIWVKQAGLILVALIPAAVWYLQTTQYLKSLQEIPSLFELFQERDSWTWFKKFWLSADIWDLIHFHFVFEFGWILIVLAILFTSDRDRKSSMLKLLGVALIQASIIGTLSGDHARFHAYYLAGIAPTAALILYQACAAMPWAVGRWLLMAGVLIHSGETAVADMSGLWNQNQGSGWFRECRALRANHTEAPWNQGLAWRTPREEYPLIDLCIGERGQADVGEWGVFRRDGEIPRDCQVVNSSDRLSLVHCSNAK